MQSFYVKSDFLLFVMAVHQFTLYILVLGCSDGLHPAVKDLTDAGL